MPANEPAQKAVPPAIQTQAETEEEETLAQDYSDAFETDGEGDFDDEMLVEDDGTHNTAETNKFDAIVGALEEAILDEEFEQRREEFCRANCHHFEDTEENKLVYTQLFEHYCTMLEEGLDAALSAAVPGFDMAEFVGMAEQRQDELTSDVFDLLLSMGDFDAFKELMLSYKQEQGTANGHAMSLACCAAAVHHEEQEDGEERPDLDGMSLTVSPLVSPAAIVPPGMRMAGVPASS